MTKISVTRALTEVKHLADRISRANKEKFIGVVKGTGDFKTCVSSPSQSPVEVCEQFVKNLQAANDLISRRERLKRAIIVSNATTNVTVSGVTMTVAEAIEKKSSIVFKKELLSQLTHQNTQASVKIEQENAKLDAEINLAVQAAYSNDKGKVDEDQYNAVAAPRVARNKYAPIDPNNVDAQIRKLQKEIEEFESEIDFVLSESNSSTMIEVD